MSLNKREIQRALEDYFAAKAEYEALEERRKRDFQSIVEAKRIEFVFHSVLVLALFSVVMVGVFTLCTQFFGWTPARIQEQLVINTVFWACASAAMLVTIFDGVNWVN